MKTKYFAFVTTNQPSIQPLEGAKDFDEADDMVAKMQKQGEIVPWIFEKQDLVNLRNEISELLN